MDSTVRPNASLMWKSLIVERGILNSGIGCRVRDGKKTKVWKDKWLPQLDSYKFQSPISILDEEAIVNELIFMDRTEWNQQLVEQIFWDLEAISILSIPLSR